MSINTVLCNGKWFRDEKSIDPSVIMSLRRIKRFNTFNTQSEKLSVLEHCAMGAMLVGKYCDYMSINFNDGLWKETYESENFRYRLIQSFLIHDLEEIVFGDIPSPVKFAGLEECKAEVRSVFGKYLNIEETKANAVQMGVKHLDAVCAFLELIDYVLLDDNLLRYYVEKISNYKIGDFVIELGGTSSSIFKDIQNQLVGDKNASDENKSKESKKEK